MKTFILLIVIAAAFCSSPYRKVENGEKLSLSETLDLFTKISNQNTEEKLKFLEDNEDRFKIFQSNVERIIRHNANPYKTYTKGINKFTDLSDEEFSRMYLGASQNCSATYNKKIPFKNRKNIPNYWDWRNKSIVSPVKNQGKCGSCWTFSTTGAIEAHYALLNNVTAPILSEQQLVDCAQAFDNHGCRGGLPSHAFEYIKYNQGLQFESDYSYEAKDGVCRYNLTKPHVQVVSGAYNITLGDEIELRDSLFEFGPVSITFQVVGDFRDYKTGVYSSKNCKNSTMDVNHAVLAVGYGTENGTDYWIVKNSWGADWGDQGYFKIERGVNMCGVAVCNAFPIMQKTRVTK